MFVLISWQDMLAVFDPRGTPFHSSMALFDKKYALVAPYSSTLGPLYVLLYTLVVAYPAACARSTMDTRVRACVS